MKQNKLLLTIIFTISSVFAYGQDWNTFGNPGTTILNNYLGTTDNNGISFRTNTVSRMTLSSAGRLGIGTNAPTSWLHIDSISTDQVFKSNTTNANSEWSMEKSGLEYGLLVSYSGTNFTVQASRRNLNFNSGYNGNAYKAMRILGTNTVDSGYVGIGNYDTFTPVSLLHLHQYGSNTNQKVDFQMTNIPTGNTATDGFKLDVGIDKLVNIRQMEDTAINIYTNNKIQNSNGLRMIIDADTINGDTLTRVAITASGQNWKTTLPNVKPSAMLHIGQPNGRGFAGIRTWMDVGTISTAGTDYLYVGLKNEDLYIAHYSDAMDAVISWGDNTTNVDGQNDLRFIFTTPAGYFGQSGATDGREAARISNLGKMGVGNFYIPAAGATPSRAIRPAKRLEVLDGGWNQAQLRLTHTQNTDTLLGRWTDFQTTNLGDLCIHPDSMGTPKRVGINTLTPQKTLEINSNDGSASPGNSGLRFTDLTSTSTSGTSNGKVLTVNTSGDVILVDDGGGNVNMCTSPVNVDFITKITNNSPNEICSSAIWESPSADQRVGIGTTSFPAYAKVGIQAYDFTGDPQIESRALDIVSDQTSGNVLWNRGITLDISGTSDDELGVIEGMEINLHDANSRAYGLIINNYCDGHYLSDNYGVIASVTGSSSNSNYGFYANAHDAITSNIGLYGSASGVSSYDNYGIKSFSNYGTESYGVYSTAYGGSTKSIGVYSEGTSSNTSIGVRTEANGGTICYGILAIADNTSTNCSNGGGCTIAAGYFDGAVYTTDDYYKSSDLRLKRNIHPILNSKSILNSLSPKSFEYDTLFAPQMHLAKGVHYGLIAQEVDQVLPGLVKSFTELAKEDTLGNVIYPQVEVKSLNYIEIIPFLIQGYKEQQAQIDSLIGIIASMSNTPQIIEDNSTSNLVNRIELSDKKGIILNQNDPNPFAESTIITYSIPEEFKSAKLIFSDNKGIIIREVIINERGAGSLEVYASDLSAGIYTYTLVVDGKVAESKKMMKAK